MKKRINLQNNKIKCNIRDDNLIGDSNDSIIENKDTNLINNDEKKNIINILENNNDNNDEIYGDEYFIYLLSIILNDYINFPNINHIETIENIELYIIISTHDYNEIKLNYEINDDSNLNNIEIFGENFVNNNKESCFLIINKKILDLKRSICLNDVFDNIIINRPIQLEVCLIEKKYKLMTNLSYMFDNISTLTSKSNFGDFNTSNIKSMKYMFNNCKLLKTLPDISNMNTENVSDMSYMFNNCSSLLNLPDISKWNTEKVNDISHMFQNCELLTSLPDISEWNTNNIEKIEEAFNNCKSLSSLPNISKWNIREEIENLNIFEGCQLLEENFKNNNSKYKKLMKGLRCFFSLLENTANLCISIIIFFLLIFIPCKYFLLIYSSFYLDEINEIIPFLKEKLNSIENTNTTLFTEILNINNVTKINETNNNQESFINNLLNYTIIDNNVKLESSIKKVQIINCIVGALGLIRYIIIFSFRSKHKFIITNFIPILILFILLNILSIILEVIDTYDLKKIIDSLTKFSNKINKFFNKENPELIENKISELNVCININNYAIYGTILMFIVIPSFYLKNILKEKLSLKTYNDYLKNRNYI